jgi:hypothetical protein
MDGHSCEVDTFALNYTPIDSSHGISEALHVTYSACYDSIMVGGLLPRKRSIHMVPFNCRGVDIDNIPNNVRQGTDIGFVIDVKRLVRDGTQVFISPSGMLLANDPIPSGYFKFVFALGSKKMLYRTVRFSGSDEIHQYESSAGEPDAGTQTPKHVQIIKCRFCGAKEFAGSVLCLSCSGNLGGERVDIRGISWQIASEAPTGGERTIDRGHRKPAKAAKEWWKMTDQEFAKYGRQLEKRAKTVTTAGRTFSGLQNRYENDQQFRMDMNGMSIFDREIKWLADAALEPIEHMGRSRWQREKAKVWVPTVWTSTGEAINPLVYDHERAEELYHQQAAEWASRRGRPQAHDRRGEPQAYHSRGEPQDHQQWYGGNRSWWEYGSSGWETGHKAARVDRDDWSAWDHSGTKIPGGRPRPKCPVPQLVVARLRPRLGPATH